MTELKLTNNPCKFCNGEIDEGKPLCGDIVDEGDVVNIVKTKDGYEIELWYPTMKKHIDHIMYELRQDAKAFVIMLVVVMIAAAVIVGTM